MKYILIILFPLFANCQTITIRCSKKAQLANIAVIAARIAYFGDSYTVGTPPGGGTTYPVKLGITYSAIPYTNYAVGGTKIASLTYSTTVGGNNLIDLYQTEINLGYTGQLVSFAYGRNDGGVGGFINATWKATYKSIIQDFITAGFPTNRLLIIAQPNYPQSAGTTTARPYVAEIASELGILYYDVFQTFVDTGANDSYWSASDGFVHPTDAGQVVWAVGYDYFLRR